MAEEASQEGFFWDSYPWVVSNKSEGGSGEDGNKSTIDKKRKMKQLEIENEGDQDVIVTIDGGSKRNGDAFEMKDEDDMKMSHGNDQRKGDPMPSNHELHLQIERERRKKLRKMFHQLHALLPQLPPKVDKSTIVDEAANYIKTLQETLNDLQRKKLERLYSLSSNATISPLAQPQRPALNTRESFFPNQSSSSIDFGIISPCISTSFSLPISSPTFFRTWTSSNVTLNVCGLDAHISIATSPKPRLLTMICFALEKRNLEIIAAEIFSDQSKSMFMIHARANATDQFVEMFTYEEIYKQAATEIMLCVNSESL